jgi:hypothetical protein
MRQQQFLFILVSFDKTFVSLCFFLHALPHASRGSSISSDDFSSLASPDSLCDKPPSTSFTVASKAKLRKKLKNSQQPQQQQAMEANAGNGHGKAQTFLKRRYSVPEIIMRK